MKAGPYTDAESTSDLHVEVNLVENCREYVHVNVAVCHPSVRWSCFHPPSRGFIVYSDIRVDK